jgi:demethylmenaquinone methyltransferase/2-methoxy-6-polyprenyl-1,4-benzoquinol methylase
MTEELHGNAAAIREMFSAIAPRYDLLNRVLSLGIDQGWRRFVARRFAVPAGGRVLDVACGTGDLTFAIVDRLPEAVLTGLDFSLAMLERADAKRKLVATRRQVSFVAGSATALPFPPMVFDGLAIAFGIRNVVDREGALAEFVRVLKPGGLAVVLEFSLPRAAWFRALYRGYFHHVLPGIGGLLARRRAYRYLPESVGRFPAPPAFAGLMRTAGFRRVRWHPLTMGIVTAYVGEVPAAD